MVTWAYPLVVALPQMLLVAGFDLVPDLVRLLCGILPQLGRLREHQV